MVHHLKRTVAQTFGFDQAPVSPAVGKLGYNILRYETVHNGAFCRVEFTDETVRGGERQVVQHRAEDVRYLTLNIKRILWRHPGLHTIYSEAIGTVGILAEYTLESEGVSIKIRRRSNGSLYTQKGLNPDMAHIARRYFKVLESSWLKAGVRLERMTVRLEPTMQGRLLLANHFDESEWGLYVGDLDISTDYESVAKRSSFLE